ncbi:MAG: polysaccharide deacetylase family protein [Bacilli bacterium]
MRKKKSNKKIVLLIVVIFVLTLIGIGLYFVLEKGNITNITKPNYDDYYSEYVITNKESKIYIKDNNEYKETGLIGKNIELSLNNENCNDGYFNIDYFDNKYYIYYEDVNKINELSKIDDRYKNYIVFNDNIVTKDNTSFYDEDDNLVYMFNEGYSLPIIIKDNDRYGVEFNNRLLYIKASDGEVISNTNTDKHNASGIGVFNYHAFYDENDPNDSCPTVICHSKKQFKEQLDYLKENNILTLKMKEVEMYIDGKIRLPKSILLTIDDGGRDKIAVDMLTEYKMYATIFLVTSWYDPSTYYKTDYIEFHSHTDDMHDTGVCPGGQGGGIKCLSEEVIQNDLKASREKLGGSTYMAYPFYEYNDYSIKMLKEAGFTMAFIGESNNSDNLVHVGSDKFRLRRFVIVTYTTINDIDKYLGQIK